MPRSWRSLPVPGRTGVYAKAPDYNTFLDQADAGADFRFRLSEQKEIDQAFTILFGLSQDPRVAPNKGVPETLTLQRAEGMVFTVWRYNKGIACKTPLGWTVMMPLAATEAPTEEESDLPPPVEPKKAGSRGRRSKVSEEG